MGINEVKSSIYTVRKILEEEREEAGELYKNGLFSDSILQAIVSSEKIKTINYCINMLCRLELEIEEV